MSAFPPAEGGPLAHKYSLSKPDKAQGEKEGDPPVTLTAFVPSAQAAAEAAGVVNQGYAGSVESLTPPAAAEHAPGPLFAPSSPCNGGKSDVAAPAPPGRRYVVKIVLEGWDRFFCCAKTAWRARDGLCLVGAFVMRGSAGRAV